MNIRFFALTLLYFTVLLYYGSSINSVNKILGGIEMSIESVPYELSFMVNNQYACCAVIINNYWAATAAHCVRATERPCEEISLRSGSSFLYEGGTVHNVVRAIVHENYDDTTNDYDIAVIEVTPPFKYDNSTKPVGLAQSDAKNVSTKWGRVCGWGYYMKINDFIDPVVAEKLQCVLLPLMSKEQCWNDYNLEFKITSRMTCYGFQKGVFDSCQGDSGSALVNKDDILLGLTSWGGGCGEPNSPGIYTDAIFLRDWIRNKTEKHSRIYYHKNCRVLSDASDSSISMILNSIVKVT